MSEVFAGIEAALSFGSLIANVTGVSLGILFGAMPGLTAAMGVALLIPLSFGMPPVEAFSMLLGMYAGAIYGGSITATVPGVPTRIDHGHPRRHAGHGGRRRDPARGPEADRQGAIAQGAGNGHVRLVFRGHLQRGRSGDLRAAAGDRRHVVRPGRIFRTGRFRAHGGGDPVFRGHVQGACRRIRGPFPFHGGDRSGFRRFPQHVRCAGTVQRHLAGARARRAFRGIAGAPVP